MLVHIVWDRQGGRDMLRDEETWSDSDLTCCFRDFDFPATKQELIDYAESNNLPDQIMDVLYDLPDKSFSSIEDLLKTAVY